MSPPRLPRRRIPISAGWRSVALVATLALLAACTTPLAGHGVVTIAPAPVTTPDATPSPQVSHVQLSDCSDQVGLASSGIAAARLKHLTVTCGKVSVPLDYSHPDDGTIGIEVLRLHDDQQQNRIGSLLINPGGPGVSGLAEPIALASSVSDEILTHFDLIGFDPRGIGLSNPLDCVAATEKDQLASLDPDIRTPTGFALAKTAEDNVAHECSEVYGPQLADYNTVFTAMDLDRIRQALGDPQLNYLGFSYGTRLGAEYAHLYPGNIRVAVLDGAVDPTLDAVASFGGQVQGFEHAFDEFAADCNTRSPCKSLGNPRQDVESLVTKANATPMQVGTGTTARYVDGAIVLTGVLYTLYNQDSWPALASALLAARKGNAQQLLSLADAYNERASNGTYSNLLEANTAVICNDSPAGPSDALIRATAAQWATQYPMFGLWSATTLFQCQSWQPVRHPLPLPTAKGSSPILVVGTINDPATPYSGTQHLATALTTGEVLTWEGQGHTAYGKSKCIDSAVDNYLVDQTMPDVGTVCPA
jgi:pimeloyl-ACP methyl ester carboxylesterase